MRLRLLSKPNINAFVLTMLQAVMMTCASPSTNKKQNPDFPSTGEDQGKNQRENPMGQEGHGGSFIASEFIRVGRGVLAHLYKKGGQGILSIDETQELEKAIDETRVEVVSEKLYDKEGKMVDARTIGLDDPNREITIQLSEDSWQFVFYQEDKVNKLVFHEYLWVIGKDDSNYKLSGMLNMNDYLRPIETEHAEEQQEAATVLFKLPITIDDGKVLFIKHRAEDTKYEVSEEGIYKVQVESGRRVFLSIEIRRQDDMSSRAWLEAYESVMIEELKPGETRDLGLIDINVFGEF